MPRLDTEQPEMIRFVPHPWFGRSGGREQIENLKPDAPEKTAGENASAEPVADASSIGRLCEQPMLSRAEERYLFLKMNHEKFQASGARGEKRAEHLSRATAIRNCILMGNLRLLVSIAGRFASPAIRTEELVSEGIVPLLGAVDLFDVSRGWAFGTYATHVLRNHFRRSGQRRERKNRLAGRLTASQQAEVADEGLSARSQEDFTRRTNRLAEECLAELPAVDQTILRTRFGFDDPDSAGLKSFAEVGEAVGLSKERVRVRTHRALERLRETAQNRQWELPELLA